jgi:hypothetical protein
VRAGGLDPKTAEELLRTGLAVRADLARELGRDFEGKVTLVLVDRLDPAEIGHPRVPAVDGFATRAWPYGDTVALPAAAARETIADPHVLRHELAHVFIDHALGDVPTWFHEGLASHLEHGRAWEAGPRETPQLVLADLARHAEELDAALVLDLARADEDGYDAIDWRRPAYGLRWHFARPLAGPVRSIGDLAARAKEEGAEESRFYDPPRAHTLGRLIVAALDAEGWPVLREDPTPRVLADPAAVVAIVRRYARAKLWDRFLAERPVAGRPPLERRCAAEALGRAEAPGAAAALEALARDPDPAVRDRAALSLLRRGDRRYAAWVLAAHAAWAPAIAAGDPAMAEDFGFMADLDDAVAVLAGGARDPLAVAAWLRAHGAELPPQVERGP